MTEFDIVIIGAGIAGAGLAAHLAGHKRVLIVETEAQPGYHSTGRSAAFWDESYGGPQVQPLTTASRTFLENPPPEFHDRSLLGPRGVLHLAQRDQAELADAFDAEFAGSGIVLDRWDRAQITHLVPGLKPEWQTGIWGPECYDIDVASLHAGYLRTARKAGAEIVTNAALQSAQWQDGQWHLQTKAGEYKAALLVNAAGAWADDVAKRAGVQPLGIQPYRRTIVQLAVEPMASADMPLVIALDGSFYFKPDSGGRLWLSPHDETACDPCDAAPEEIDIAIAIDRLQQVVDWQVKRVEHSWAGLRSFAPDRLPVIGRDPDVSAFFWLVGQGGFGIQTAPAISQLAASQLCEAIAAPANIDASLYALERLRAL